MVLFSDKAEIREYVLKSFEKFEKKQEFQKIRKKSRGFEYLARILYNTALPTEEEYVNLRMDGKKSIRCIKKCSFEVNDFITLYSNNDKKLRYRLYENYNDKLVLEIEGILTIVLDGTFMSEYQAKMDLIEIVRDICKKKKIF